MRAVAVIAVGIVLVSMAAIGVDFAAFLREEQPGFNPPSLTVWLAEMACLFLFVSPLISAAQAAAFTAREMGGDEFKLLRLSPLTERQMLVGYIAGSLNTLRVWVAAAIGSTPVAVLGVTYTMMVFTHAPGAPWEPTTAWLLVSKILKNQLANTALAWLGFSVALLSMHGVAVTAGAWGAMIVRRVAPAVMAAVGLIAMAMIGLHIVILNPSLPVNWIDTVHGWLLRPENYVVTLGGSVIWAGEEKIIQLVVWALLIPCILMSFVLLAARVTLRDRRRF